MRSITWQMPGLTPKQGGVNQHTSHDTSTYLSQQVSKEPPNEGSKSLGGDWVLVKSLGVRFKSRNGSSTGDGRITEERAHISGILAEGRVVDEGRLGEAL